MNRRHFLAAGAAAAAAHGRWPRWSVAATHANPSRLRRGVNICGAEAGVRQTFSNANPGRAEIDYTYNSEQTIAYFADQGLTLFRIPFRWERIQPRLGEELHQAELRRLQQFVGWARKHGCRVILDVQNFARYTLEIAGKPRDCLIDALVDGRVRVTREHFADLWSQLSEAFVDEPAIEAYGLMNEPHDMGSSDWKAISQRAVDAIRARGDRQWIFVPGDGWSNSNYFRDINGPQAWVRDPLGRVAYEAHCYFDYNYSGAYRLSYEEEFKRDPELEQRGGKRLQQFIEWLRANEVRGFLGEFGVPSDSRWLRIMEDCLHTLDAAGIEGCYWAAGEWLGLYPLSIQPDAAQLRKDGIDGDRRPQLDSMLAGREA
ncbi:MAG TPA: glycoside hydrolase family 5 protein [Pirellulales bacterium]|nr:glycoside hydrolase family 5 protein [Pirellulales bacterium]